MTEKYVELVDSYYLIDTEFKFLKSSEERINCTIEINYYHDEKDHSSYLTG